MLAFISYEIKQLVFLNRSTEGPAECVAQELGRNVWLTRFDFGLLVEPVVGDCVSGSIVLVEAAVVSVGSTARNQRNLRARGAARIGVGVGGNHAKLFNRVAR